MFTYSTSIKRQIGYDTGSILFQECHLPCIQCTGTHILMKYFSVHAVLEDFGRLLESYGKDDNNYTEKQSLSVKANF